MENVRTPKERAEEVLDYMSIVQATCLVNKDDLAAANDANMLVEQKIRMLVDNLLVGVRDSITIESYPTADADIVEFKVSLCVISDRHVFASVTTTAFEMAERDIIEQLGV
ncbi:MAG TPA: hypothetical protein PKW49_00970 [Paludibacteraceae bacterium]|nr:hypothetical protein [Paludibacteraceae bacterium]